MLSFCQSGGCTVTSLRVCIWPFSDEQDSEHLFRSVLEAFAFPPVFRAPLSREHSVQAPGQNKRHTHLGHCRVISKGVGRMLHTDNNHSTSYRAWKCDGSVGRGEVGKEMAKKGRRETLRNIERHANRKGREER